LDPLNPGQKLVDGAKTGFHTQPVALGLQTPLPTKDQVLNATSMPVSLEFGLFVAENASASCPGTVSKPCPKATVSRQAIDGHPTL
jgi:hypothetical protein